jgi:protein-L-isoaspartate(D-aspartate) O-methyltransferase
MVDTRAIELIMALRGQGITDRRVLSAIERTPRELFVDEPFEGNAYDNSALPIACGQTISQPFVVAYMTEQLEVGPQHRILEIGTGSGYQAAVLSRLAREVVTIERYRTLADSAHERLQMLGYTNVTVRLGDGMAGAPDLPPFDRIMVTAAAEDVPDALVAQLAAGGKLVLPVGPRHDAQYLVKLTKQANGKLTREELIAVRFVPLLPGQAREL